MVDAPRELEQEVLAALAAADRFPTPGEVRGVLGAELADTTVMTVLARSRRACSPGRVGGRMPTGAPPRPSRAADVQGRSAGRTSAARRAVRLPARWGSCARRPVPGRVASGRAEGSSIGGPSDKRRARWSAWTSRSPDGGQATRSMSTSLTSGACAAASWTSWRTAPSRWARSSRHDRLAAHAGARSCRVSRPRRWPTAWAAPSADRPMLGAAAPATAVARASSRLSAGSSSACSRRYTATQLPRGPSLIPSSRAICAVGGEFLMTAFAASSLHSDENFRRSRGTCPHFLAE
jgi:hypothetical protein